MSLISTGSISLDSTFNTIFGGLLDYGDGFDWSSDFQEPRNKSCRYLCLLQAVQNYTEGFYETSNTL
jgi:hypothetical protein